LSLRAVSNLAANEALSPVLIGDKGAPLALALGRTQHYKLQDVAYGVEDGPQVCLVGLKRDLANKQLPAQSRE
jgi:hypothetical protein